MLTVSVNNVLIGPSVRLPPLSVFVFLSSASGFWAFEAGAQTGHLFWHLSIHHRGFGGKTNESKTPLTQASLLNIVTV